MDYRAQTKKSTDFTGLDHIHGDIWPIQCGWEPHKMTVMKNEPVDFNLNFSVWMFMNAEILNFF